MNTHFEILIDASGSMGYMKGTKDENKCLLPDGSTRMDLAKMIVIQSLLPQLKKIDHLKISLFKRFIDPVSNIEKSTVDIVYETPRSFENARDSVQNIKNPMPGGTPLNFALVNTLFRYKGNKTVLIYITDGGATDHKHFDSFTTKQIKKNNYDTTIHFIGIDQNEIAQNKSKRICDFTEGNYVNVEAINYDKTLFDNFLFELKSSINQEALSATVSMNAVINKSVDKPIDENPQENTTNATAQKIEQSTDIKALKKDDKTVKKLNEEVESEKEEDTLQQIVSNNSKALGLVSDKLQMLTDQVNYLRKSTNTSDEDEFVESDEDEEANKQTGYHCERLLYRKLKIWGWQNVVWLNKNSEQFKSYDFTAEKDGVTYYIECKGTKSNSIEFALTKKEWLFYLNNKPNYYLVFVNSITENQTAFYRYEDLLHALENKKILPCSSSNRKVKANRMWFQINE